ncbi:MAG: S46 family peptidase, partial [Bacteroidetes bacterium]|nr:S46 family peptidase [Bacteroidota bacterium]
MKRFILLLITVACVKVSRADEGMWLIQNIDRQLWIQMKNKGLLLSADQIYHADNHSLKDAIVAINGGSCSGSLISANGLLITNHHCAYGDIHALSTSENNLLEDGFWAMTQDNEIPIKGKSVTFLKKVVDVTEEAKIIIDSLDQLGPRGIRFMSKVEMVFSRKYGMGDNAELSLASMWRGNRFYLYFLDTYEDVRLVGAPPVSIGAFGGEQDNWGWPQHKGDFALYRIYMSKEGKPAKYSPDNIPYTTGNFLKVSSKGFKEGDFTMILGYPGSTNRYVPSAEVQHKFEVMNPVISTVRRLKLDVLKSKMDSDADIRLKYQDKYFGISNYCDYAKWENICIERYHVVGIRAQEEAELRAWIHADPDRVKEYGAVLDDIERYYSSVKELSENRELVRETMVRGSDWLLFAQRLNALINGLKRRNITTLDLTTPEVANFVKINYRGLFLEGDPAVEREVFITMFNYLINNVHEKYFTEEFKKCLHTWHSDMVRYADSIYQNSFLADPTRFMRFFTQSQSVDN